VFAVSFLRLAIRQAHRELVKARFDLRRVLIVGAREEALRLAEQLTGTAELGIDVVGYVDGGAESLGRVENISGIAERFKAQEVLVCDSYEKDPALAPFLDSSRRRMIEVKFVSSLARTLGPGVRVESLAGIPVFSLQRKTLVQLERALKRSGDIAAGLVWLPIASLGSLACRIYGTMGGKTRFWSETRTGRRGAPLSWPRAAAASGRELGDVVKPRLCLALIGGRLSLVGPPPLYPAQAAGLSVDLAAERPGITGAWRLDRAGRLERSLEDEAFRIGSWSIWGDLIVVVESLGIFCSGFYPAWFGSEGGTPCDES
jgi:lipopolysaccharide/colanic/teichoic acid biosynthesis glycosyltransferase